MLRSDTSIEDDSIDTGSYDAESSSGASEATFSGASEVVFSGASEVAFAAASEVNFAAALIAATFASTFEAVIPALPDTCRLFALQSL